MNYIINLFIVLNNIVIKSMFCSLKYNFTKKYLLKPVKKTISLYIYKNNTHQFCCQSKIFKIY